MTNNSKSRDWIRIGVNVWGGVTTVLGFLIFATLAYSAIFINTDGTFEPSAPDWIKRIYTIMREQGTLIGAIIGFSALAWAHFFQAYTPDKTASLQGETSSEEVDRKTT